MFTRRNTTQEADRKQSITSYLHTMEPRLTSSDDSGNTDELYSKRLLKQLLAELEANLPEDHHICQLNYDRDPMGYTESMGILLLIPADADDPSYAMKQHKLADQIAAKAFTKVMDLHPDDGGYLLFTYGVLPCGTLTIDT